MDCENTGVGKTQTRCDGGVALNCGALECLRGVDWYGRIMRETMYMYRRNNKEELKEMEASGNQHGVKW